jgi:hypothetical protein
MSLIYQALRHMQAQDTPVPAPGLRPLPRTRRYLPWLLRLGVPLGIVASLASAWAFAPEPMPDPGIGAVATTALPEQTRATETPPAAAMPAPPKPVAPEPAAPEPAAPVPVEKPAPAPVAASGGGDMQTTTRRGVTVVDTPAPPALPAGALVRHERRGKAAKTDDAQVQQAIARLNVAIRDGRYAEARHDLDYVSARLPADSLTLLRMRAWYAAQSGNGDAEVLYRQILGRLPDDENAGVNLALVRARAGDYAGAKVLLERVKTRDPDSPVVRDALDTIRALQP